MRTEAGARMRRYLRVAYEGGSEPPERAPTRWAAPPGAATRVAAVLLVLVVAALTYLLMARIPPAPAAPDAPSATPSAPVEAASTPVSEAATGAAATGGAGQAPSVVVVVHVAGAVVDPGLVEVPEATRVAEAIELAGGPTGEADLDALNLAAPVTDGQQVYVPREGEAAPPASSGATDVGGAGPGDLLVNVNTADAAALDTLPGIGPALAERIIAWRTENGPFASVDALTSVSGIGPATLERLREKVTV